jgi:hypothetical protein
VEHDSAEAPHELSPVRVWGLEEACSNLAQGSGFDDVL